MRYQEHLALHVLAIKKFAAADTVADLAGLPVEAVRKVLAGAVAVGRVAEVEGKYALLPAGRLIVKGEYSRHYHHVRSDSAFVDAYEAFEKLNDDLKTLITRWQVRDVAGAQVPNDHSDTEYDDKIIDRLGRIHNRVEPLLGTMSERLPRFGGYLPAFNNALERAERGEIAWVSDVQLASYHTVWFELHEDLLCLLGRTRAE